MNFGSITVPHWNLALSIIVSFTIPSSYIFTGLNTLKPEMIEEATKNAREVAEKFARDSNSEVGQIRGARQGLFSITSRDVNTPQIKKVRVVTTIDFQLQD